MKPIIMLCFKRSGGTLLSRIFNTDPNIVLVSEVNPNLGITPEHTAASADIALKKQMNDWYGIQLKSEGFKECVLELTEYCSIHKKQLILRDWTHFDFYPCQWNNFSPSYKFSIMEQLNGILDYKCFSLVRDGVDVFISSGGTIDEFSKNYLIYLKALNECQIPTMKYEDITTKPNSLIEEFRDKIGLTFYGNTSSLELDKLKTTGDVQLGKKSRGNKSGLIQALPRKWVSYKMRKAINASKDLMDANSLFNYSACYEDRKAESFFSMLKRKLFSI